MLGSGLQRVKVLAGVVLCVAMANACFWSRYPEQVRTHAELLVAMARKGRDLIVGGRFTAESLPELMYPLERARAYAANVRAWRSPAPRSLDAFDALVERYRVYVDVVDRLRREPRGPEAPPALVAALADVEAGAQPLWAALDEEAGRRR